jgi:hypothetical protein
MEYDLLHADTLESTGAADVLPNLSIALHTNINIHNTFLSRNNGRTNILEYFVRGASGTRSVYGNTTTDVRSEVLNRNISDIEVWLTDLDHQALELRGLHWHVTLLFEIEADE